MRIVRLPTGGVELDETHKKPGRGAYLCENRACWETALAKKLLEHALKTEVTQEEKEALWERCRTLPTESPERSAALARG
jgi:predicted RNA-binding protein YlxR (DUF448 family)